MLCKVTHCAGHSFYSSSKSASVFSFSSCLILGFSRLSLCWSHLELWQAQSLCSGMQIAAAAGRFRHGLQQLRCMAYIEYTINESHPPLIKAGVHSYPLDSHSLQCLLFASVFMKAICCIFSTNSDLHVTICIMRSISCIYLTGVCQCLEMCCQERYHLMR